MCACTIVYAVLCCAEQGKPTMVLPGEQHGLPRSWFVLERTRTAGAHGFLLETCAGGVTVQLLQQPPLLSYVGGRHNIHAA